MGPEDDTMNDSIPNYKAIFQLAHHVADYMEANKITPWPDEAVMRQTVLDATRVIFTEALPEARQLLQPDGRTEIKP